jgi:hypothetical protein
MNYLKSFWNYLDGKKTVISALAGLALAWAQAKGWISGEDAIYAASALTLITGVSVGDKIRKASQ